MKRIILLIFTVALFSCSSDKEGAGDILVLTHSTGRNLYDQGDVPGLIEKYNSQNDTQYSVKRIDFPTARFYGWKNYPYDYWFLWVENKGYRFKPSLRKVSRGNDMVVWKHCFPGSMIEEDPISPSVNDEKKSLAVYKLQYEALKVAMHSYPDTKFLVWTLAVMREEEISKEQALRTREFVEWVKDEWDEPGDNIHIWDFYSLETTSEDGSDQSLYLRPEYATVDAHPNNDFNERTAPFLVERVLDVLNGAE